MFKFVSVLSLYCILGRFKLRHSIWMLIWNILYSKPNQTNLLCTAFASFPQYIPNQTSILCNAFSSVPKYIPNQTKPVNCELYRVSPIYSKSNQTSILYCNMCSQLRTDSLSESVATLTTCNFFELLHQGYCKRNAHISWKDQDDI